MRRIFGRSSSGSPQQSSPSPGTLYPLSTPTEFTTSGRSPKPIRLVYCDANGKFQMDPEAVAMLQLVKGPVGVVSVCGRARQGKSFILNQLLGRSTGFVVASTQKPCTKGIWLWSAPLKRTALDGTEYNLLLLDTEGIEAYDQTGTYSTQIFSLAVLLSTMFIYNQVGGIDESALDHLSLVTEMTKHIRVKASGGSTASDLGQFAPIFVWLLRDFYLDLEEGNRKITPRDYLELALRPVQSGGKDVAAKNEIRESIRALFPDRECFTLVRPLSNEEDLRHMDQFPLDKLRPEFKSGLDALTRFVFERTRPKQVGGTVMTGPLLARITQSFLDALNNGAVPTITSSWKSVEESECQRAYDTAAELYMSSFDHSKATEEAALLEAHEYAVQKSLVAFNNAAVGSGPTRQKYEKRLQTFIKKAFEDIKRDMFHKTDLLCSNAINNMEKNLRTTCNIPNIKVDHVTQVMDDLISKYESECNGPDKWKKLSVFLRRSLEGPIHDLIRKQIDQIGCERTSLALKCRGIEDMLKLKNKQLEASEQQKSDYLKRYEDAINDKKRLVNDYMHRINDLQSKSSFLEEKCSSGLKALDSGRQDCMEWKKKYEQLLSKQKAEEKEATSEIALLKSESAGLEARLVAAHEEAQCAQEEAAEWKRRYDFAAREGENALEKVGKLQEWTNEQTRLREEALRAEFSISYTQKEEELKEKTLKVEEAERQLTILHSGLKAAEAKIRNYDSEISILKIEIKELAERLENSYASVKFFEKEARMLEQERTHLERKYVSEFGRFEEVEQRCESLENEARRATELADKARAEVNSAQIEKNEFRRAAMEGRTQLERVMRDIEKLERETRDLMIDLQNSNADEREAQLKVLTLESRVQEREKEIESLLRSNNEERAVSVHVLEELLENERAERAHASKIAEAHSVQLQATQHKLDQAQQQLTAMRLNESALHGKNLRTGSKRARTEDESVHNDDDHQQPIRKNKRSRISSTTTAPLKFGLPEGIGSTFTGGNEDDSSTFSEDYTKFTVQKLKQELTKHDFGAELLQLNNPNKKTILALYEKCILKKP